MNKLYLHNSLRDLQSLGLAPDTTQIPSTRPELYSWILDRVLPGDPELAPEVDPGFTPLTELGETALRSARLFPDYDRAACRFICCVTAEDRLLSTIDPLNVQNRTYVSPVIVQHQGQNVGIVKSYGEAVCYGLEDVPEFGLIKGLFSQTPTSVIGAMRQDSRAHTTRLSSLGRMLPVRVASFALPPEALSEIIPVSESDKTVLTTDHETIVGTIDLLAENSKPLNRTRRVVSRLLG